MRRKNSAMKKKVAYVLVDSLKEMKTIVPAFFIATLIGVTLEICVPIEITYAVLQESPVLSIVLATIIGIILPIPRYATYPIAFSLFQKGASIGVIFALISGEVILGSPDRDAMEFKYFGWKAFTLRLVLCTAFVVVGGFVAEVLL
jgi:uncharacterized membrane protein YraQ (UPF0718 family)